MFSPIDSENRRLSVDERKEYKITTISMTTIFVAIYGVLLYAELEYMLYVLLKGYINCNVTNSMYSSQIMESV